MADKTCPQCSETVDEAKAFCPACGNAFVDEEKRTDRSAYESMDHTVQMGNTMYNAMLSDMGLNIKKPEPEKRVEVLKPAVAAPTAVTPPAAVPASSTISSEPKKSRTALWIVLATLGVLALIGLIIAAVAVAVLFFRISRT